MPTLILLPGLHGTADLFHPLLALIPPHIPTRIISHPTNRICTNPTLLKLLEAQLRNESGLILLAESFSGPLALQFAAAYPARVRAVILCCSFIAPPVPRLLCYLAAPFILLCFPLLNSLLRLFLAGSHAPRSLLHETRRAIRSVNPLVLAHRVQQAAHINAAGALKNCPVPILCLAGTRDRLVGPRALRRIRRIRPDLPIKLLDAPHLLLQTKPAEAWHEITHFPPVAKWYTQVEVPI